MNQVLVVDDERWWAQQQQKTLEASGFLVTVVASVTEALASLDELSPQAIVLDFRLPDANALQLLHELQSYDDTHSIPIILCTSLSEARHYAQALGAYGVRQILDKTIMTPKQLVTAVESVIV